MPRLSRITALDDITQQQIIAKLARILQKSQGARATQYQTHISRILVCGDVAYKFRRPIKLPFADFSTLAKRRADCQREWRLNQRTAATLYLGIITITGTLDAPKPGGTDRALDVALLMRRFRQSALLNNLVQNNRVSTDLATSLGQHLGDFMHALPGLPASTISSLRPVNEWLDDSLTEICTLEAALTESMSVVRRWCETQHKQLHPLMRQRQRDGFYRDGHGDLHLANLVRFEGTVMAFDALEFNDDLRQTDIINDIAFTFMDLLAFKRADLAWTLINAWCERTGDYDGLKLLRFYTMYRAVVRAKVALLNDDCASFDRYWCLVQALTKPAHAPHLVLLHGLSGSGKSTVAAALASGLSAVRLRADVIRKRLFPDRPANPAKLYVPQATEATYGELARLTQLLLASHMTVIVDATFLSQDHIDLFIRLAHRWRITPHVLECHAPVAILRQRIEHRARKNLDPSDATVAVLQRQISQQQQHPATWPVPVSTINTHTSRAVMNRHIQKYISDILAGPPSRP
jgi:hypothetical protein